MMTDEAYVNQTLWCNFSWN